jgi:hypothetical protein
VLHSFALALLKINEKEILAGDAESSKMALQSFFKQMITHR